MNETEMAETAVFVSLSGVGISLINGLREEVAYISLNSGTTIWEVQDKNRWKLLSKEIATLMEQQWQIDDTTRVVFEDVVEVCTAVAFLKFNEFDEIIAKIELLCS